MSGSKSVCISPPFDVTRGIGWLVRPLEDASYRRDNVRRHEQNISTVEQVELDDERDVLSDYRMGVGHELAARVGFTRGPNSRTGEIEQIGR